jgi:hypothetical protein
LKTSGAPAGASSRCMARPHLSEIRLSCSLSVLSAPCGERTTAATSCSAARSVTRLIRARFGRSPKWTLTTFPRGVKAAVVRFRTAKCFAAHTTGRKGIASSDAPERSWASR